MVSAQESDKSWWRSELDEYQTTFQKWRQESFGQKLIDVVCVIVLAAIMFIMCLLIAVGSEYGGRG